MLDKEFTKVVTTKERMMLEAYGVCQDCSRIVSWRHKKCPGCGSEKIAIHHMSRDVTQQEIDEFYRERRSSP